MAAPDPVRQTREAMLTIGREIALARANHGLTQRMAARLANVAKSTVQRVERGDPAVQLDTLTRITSAVGLRLWTRAYPAPGPSLRDSGQLEIAQAVRSLLPRASSMRLEVPVAGGRSIDAVVFGPTEIVAVEIERMLVDFQAQYRAAVAKRDELASAHARPVRLVILVLDSRRNRRVCGEWEALIRSALPAGSREVLSALRHGRDLGRDGLAWVRPRDRSTPPWGPMHRAR